MNRVNIRRQVIIYTSAGLLSTCQQTSVKFESKYKTFHLRKCIWKCRQRNDDHSILSRGRWVNKRALHAPDNTSITIIKYFAAAEGVEWSSLGLRCACMYVDAFAHQEIKRVLLSKLNGLDPFCKDQLKITAELSWSLIPGTCWSWFDKSRKLLCLIWASFFGCIYLVWLITSHPNPYVLY